MEQPSHLQTAAAEQAAAAQRGDASPSSHAAAGEAVLREELAKWRERVPKLAAALRNRAEETDSLRQEIERLRQGSGARDESPAAGIRARDELIEELQNKLADLAERHKLAQGELHARQLTVEELKSDAESWKRKWQAVTRSLDEQAAEVSSHDQRTRALEEENAGLRQRLAEQVSAHESRQRMLDETVEERDSLRGRNEQLFETTEIANRQICSLTDSLAELRVNLKQLREQLATLTAERDEAAREAADLRGQLTGLETQQAQDRSALQAALDARDAAHREVESVRGEARGVREQADTARARVRAVESELAAGEAELAAVTEALHLTAVAAASGARAAATVEGLVAEATRQREAAEKAREAVEARRAEVETALAAERAEVERLTGVVAQAQQTIGERESERRQLSDRVQTLENRNRHLEEQLSERSALVVTLEHDQAEAVRRREGLQEERDGLEEALMRAERNAKENADYVAQLDAKLERQKELMDSLEEELAEAKDEAAQAKRALKERPAGTADGGGETERLREQVRKLEGLVRERTEAVNRLQWQQEVAAHRGDADGAGQSEQAPEDDAKLLMVLNQQLTEERARNEALRARVQQLEATSGGRRDGDDLTRIHGVGHKLAEQLNELGIHRYQQIAELDAGELDDEAHVLHAHRGRITRDRWIEQAVKLISH